VKKPFPFFALLSCIFLSAFPGDPQDLGITFGFNSSARTSTGGPGNHSLFKPTGSDADWWDDMVEELSYSGVDFIAPVCRGYSPNHPNTDAGDPRKLPDLVAAMNRRPLDNTFKIAIFDDCPASWTANRNLDNGEGYDYSPLFDCADTSNYKYIWDYNIKLCIQNIPDEKRYKINNRMVLFFWTITSAFAKNQSGNLKKILLRLRADCQATYGFNPYLIVDRRFFDDDPSCNDPAVVDAAHDWFAAPIKSWTLQSFNNVKVGCLCPGFAASSSGAYMNPGHGQRLIDGLNGTVKAGARLTLGEGFTDEEEMAAWWRSNDTVYYDYPNQRLDITRRYTGRAFANSFKVEAEACDACSDKTTGNSGNLYRIGDLDVARCSDANGGWMVTNTQAGEWLEWKELPLPAHTKFTVRYSSNAAASIRFSVDGIALSETGLASTGGSWATAGAGIFSAAADGPHTVRLTVVSGSPELNYFIVQQESMQALARGGNAPAAQNNASGGRMLVNSEIARAVLHVPQNGGGRYHVDIYSISGRKTVAGDFTVREPDRTIPLPAMPSGACVYRMVPSR
jgi:hypothetical protein